MKQETKKAVRNMFVGCVLGLLIMCAGLLLGGQFGFSVRIVWDTDKREANAVYAAAEGVQYIEAEADAGEIIVQAANEGNVGLIPAA